nr:hypothetical protein BaRGS_014512 [Batillaria attramentaria]
MRACCGKEDKSCRVSRERWTRPTICTWPLVLLSTLSLSIGTFLFIRFHRVPLAAVVKEPELNDGYWAESTYDSVLSAYSVDSGIDDEFMVIPPSLPPGKSHPPSEALKQVILGLADFPDEEYLVQNESLFVPRETVVNSYTPEYIIQAQELCEADGPFLLVAVPSIRNHTIRRKAIRKTWAGPGYGSPWPRKTLRHSVKVVFFFGTGVEGDKDVKLEAEAKLYGDIVQADFVDTYRNLTLKMAAVLHWTANHCPGARHVIKVDEDTIVNLPLLVDVLELVSAHQGRYVMGYKHLSKQPIVIREGRWKVDEDAYPLSVFPNYLYGHSYVISGDAVQELLSAYQRMPSVPTEDAFFTGILAKACSYR